MLSGQGARELDDVPVEKRHAVFDAMCHGYFVLAHEQVDEMRLHVVLQTIREMVCLPLLEQGAALVECGPQVGFGSQPGEAGFGMKLRSSNECVSRWRRLRVHGACIPA